MQAIYDLLKINLARHEASARAYFDLQKIFLEAVMIKCHLSRLMGERRLKISDVVRDTGLNRGTITRLYHETAERVELDVLNTLCRYFGCELSELFEYIRDPQPQGAGSEKP